jgi:hypothetical protein
VYECRVLCAVLYGVCVRVCVCESGCMCVIVNECMCLQGVQCCQCPHMENKCLITLMCYARAAASSEPPDAAHWARMQNDPGRTRTCNLWFRRPTPYPLGHRAPCAGAMCDCWPMWSTKPTRQIQFSCWFVLSCTFQCPTHTYPSNHA